MKKMEGKEKDFENEKNVVYWTQLSLENEVY